MLVDGVPRDINYVKPSEIKTITFLKGAQAVVLYGSRGANGVILVTTKRGSEGPMRINVRANTGWNVAKSYPENFGSAESRPALHRRADLQLGQRAESLSLSERGLLFV